LRRHILDKIVGIQSCISCRADQPLDSVAKEQTHLQLNNLANHAGRFTSASPAIILSMGLAMVQHRKAPEPADSVSYPFFSSSFPRHWPCLLPILFAFLFSARANCTRGRRAASHQTLGGIVSFLSFVPEYTTALTGPTRALFAVSVSELQGEYLFHQSQGLQ